MKIEVPSDVELHLKFKEITKDAFFANDQHAWKHGVEYGFKLANEQLESSVAPQKKKVLWPWVEIYQIETKAEGRNFLSLGLIALAKDQIDKMAGKTREEIPGSDTFPEEWFTEETKR